MIGKRPLALLLLGLGLTCTVFPVKGPAQVPILPSGHRKLDEARMATLLQAMRQHALALKPEDIVKLSAVAKPLAPLLPKPGESSAKPSAKPMALPSEKGKSSAKAQRLAVASTKEHKEATTKASSPAPAKVAQPDSKEKPSFNPYPQ